LLRPRRPCPVRIFPFIGNDRWGPAFGHGNQQLNKDTGDASLKLLRHSFWPNAEGVREVVGISYRKHLRLVKLVV
jgi:hypothetical protein